MLARVFNATDPHPLRSAAAYADMPALQKQIEKNKKNLDAADMAGMTALLYAVQNGHEEAAVLLMFHGAKADVKNQSGQTPLMFACENCLSGATEKILQQNVPLDTQDVISGDTALIKACRAGHGWAACRLVAAGADMDAENKKGETAEMLARENLDARDFILFTGAVRTQRNAAADAAAAEARRAQDAATTLQRDIIPLNVVKLHPRRPK
ncbi:MAG: ankyrin repeat domain-containing protein [Bdellovibrionales bacterium]|jgi:ankyrin repeat protein|nr:ankyrin repeat domain-containing protein [Bdellovibrionales bacterium]